jgi:hypothetical protein
MGTRRPPQKAILLVGALFSNEDYYIAALQRLEEKFGEMIMESPKAEWDFSEYYKRELGTPIYRRFVFFKESIEKESLPEIKAATNEIEKLLSTDGKRNINLDPGYLTPAKLVLASTKNYSHRIYLRDGIYAEVTLVFHHGRFLPHINTYREYQDEKNLKIFMMARKLLGILRQRNNA